MHLWDRRINESPADSALMTVSRSNFSRFSYSKALTVHPTSLPRDQRRRARTHGHGDGDQGKDQQPRTSRPFAVRALFKRASGRSTLCDMRLPPPLRRESENTRFVLLFILILCFHVVLPLTDDVPYIDALVGAGFLLLLGWSGWITLKPQWRKPYGFVMLASFAFTSLRFPAEAHEITRIVWLIFHAGHFFLTSALLARWAVTRPQVTLNTIFAALSGMYMLGFAWALFYVGLDLLAADSFNRPLSSGKGLSEGLYFSFVTLTTLGYGDIVPVSSFARSLATTQALMGQIYSVVLVARLVSLYSAPPPSQRAN